MFSDVGALRSQIRAYKLHRLEDQLVSLAKPCIRMVPVRIDDDTVPMGASRFGGHPDVPKGFEWPHLGGKPLTFIGQFNLAEVALHDVSNLLPKSGRLYFFFEAAELPYGKSDERDGWRVLFFEDETSPLIRLTHPTLRFADSIVPDFTHTIKALPAHMLTFSSEVSLPPIYGDETADYGISFETLPQVAPATKNESDNPTRSEHDLYWELYAQSRPGPRHFWLGHPDRIQYFIEWNAVVLSQRIMPEGTDSWGNRVFSPEQISGRIRPEMAQWQFLFQIDSDDSLNVKWGDVGTLYVCIPKVSLAMRDFDACWTIMQCS